jgi:hypothetical protein
MRQEYILCSAIWYQDGEPYAHQPKNIESGFVICGRRHHNIINTIGQKFYFRTSENKHVQGFLTNLDRFVDRKEAAEIAYAYGQIPVIKKELYSEDLY